MLNSFSTREMADISGVNHDTLHTWNAEGVLIPREIRRTKKRQVSVYGKQEVFAVCVAASLMRQGLRGTVIHKVIRFLSKADLTQRLATGERYLVIVNGTQVFAATPLAVFQAKDGTQTAAFTIVDLEVAKRQFEARLPGILAGTRTTGRVEKVAEPTAP